MKVALIVPVMKNFKGAVELFKSIDIPVQPFIIDNWNENIGVSKAWNKGLALAQEFDAAFVVNDDVTFAPGAMDKMLSYVKDYDLISAVGGDSEMSGIYEIIDNGSPDFACFAVKPKDFVDKFGTFDENFTPAYFEDNDMRYRVVLGGGRLGIVMDARMYHGGSVTQNWEGQRVVSHKMFEDNRDYFVKKWGGLPGSESYNSPFNGITNKTFKDW